MLLELKSTWWKWTAVCTLLIVFDLLEILRKRNLVQESSLDSLSIPACFSAACIPSHLTFESLPLHARKLRKFSHYPSSHAYQGSSGAYSLSHDLFLLYAKYLLSLVSPSLNTPSFVCRVRSSVVSPFLDFLQFNLVARRILAMRVPPTSIDFILVVP